ncbi:MAG: cupin domain-containing protein [Ginsengibacter sp.]
MKIVLLILLPIGMSALKAQKTGTLLSRVYKWDGVEAIKEKNPVRREIMGGSTTALADFKVQATTLDAGKASRYSHSHNDRDELIIIKDGRLKITVNNTSKIMGPKSIAYVMTGDGYGIENTGITPATYYLFRYKSKIPRYIEHPEKNNGSFLVNADKVPVNVTGRGSRQSFFSKSTSQLAEFEMHITALNEGFDSHAPHTHLEEETILILKGNAEMFIAGAHYNAIPGDVVFLSSGVLHALKNTGKGVCEYFAFQWKN